jgi:hypothetical protein
VKGSIVRRHLAGKRVASAGSTELKSCAWQVLAKSHPQLPVSWIVRGCRFIGFWKKPRDVRNGAGSGQSACGSCFVDNRHSRSLPCNQPYNWPELPSVNSQLAVKIGLPKSTTS